MPLDKDSSEYQTLKKTIYGEARGEDQEGQRAVAWVIKTRAGKDREYWGGNSIEGVCLKSGQFQCWDKDKRQDTENMAEWKDAEHKTVDGWLPSVYDHPDPSRGADHYNNPDKEGYPPWTKNCNKGRKIGLHQFYHGHH